MNSPTEAPGPQGPDLVRDGLPPLALLFARLEEEPADEEVLAVLCERLLDRGQPELAQTLIRKARAAVPGGELSKPFEALSRRVFSKFEVVPAPPPPRRELASCFLLLPLVFGLFALGGIVGSSANALPERAARSRLAPLRAGLQASEPAQRQEAARGLLRSAELAQRVLASQDFQLMRGELVAALAPTGLGAVEALESVHLLSQLGSWPAREWAPTLASGLEHPDASVRAATAQALGALTGQGLAFEGESLERAVRAFRTEPALRHHLLPLVLAPSRQARQGTDLRSLYLLCDACESEDPALSREALALAPPLLRGARVLDMPEEGLRARVARIVARWLPGAQGREDEDLMGLAIDLEVEGAPRAYLAMVRAAYARYVTKERERAATLQARSVRAKDPEVARDLQQRAKQHAYNASNVPPSFIAKYRDLSLLTPLALERLLEGEQDLAAQAVLEAALRSHGRGPR
ncbi:MAG: hypothetical protein AB7N76_13750 [Planctomycetota bacterium]